LIAVVYFKQKFQILIIKKKNSDLVLLALPQKSNFTSLFFSLVLGVPKYVWQQVIKMSSNQNVKSSKCQVIKVSSHQSGKWSKWQSLKQHLTEAATHQSGKSSKQHLIEATTHQNYIYGTYSLKIILWGLSCLFVKIPTHL